MNNLRRPILISMVLVLALLTITTGPVRAHVLKADKGISAVLHIPPDDNPAAGEPTRLYLSFGDAAGAFSLQNCSCQVVISSNGQVVQSAAPKPALQGATLNSLVTVNFPSKGVYDVLVKGKAVNGSFPDFKLDFLVRVAAAAHSPSSGSSGSAVLIIGAGSLVVLGLVGATSIRYGGRYQKKSHQINKPRSKK